MRLVCGGGGIKGMGWCLGMSWFEFLRCWMIWVVEWLCFDEFEEGDG